MRARASIFFLTLLILFGCAPLPPIPTSRPTTAPVSPALAVEYALDALHGNNPQGKLIGQPQTIQGSVMPLSDAHALVNARPLPASSPNSHRAQRLVWLVVTRGTWLLRIPGAHGDPLRRTPMVKPKDLTVPDLWHALLFDAVTGQIYEQGGIVPSQFPLLESLPALPLP